MTDKPIDLTVFAELKATTGPEFAAGLVDTFLDEAPGMLAELRSARTHPPLRGLKRPISRLARGST